jgi:hypothetical protein
MSHIHTLYDEIARQQRSMGGEHDPVSIINLVAARSGNPISQVQRVLGRQPQEMSR